jgi:hypothetical protein
MVASVMVPAWGRCVFTVLAISILFGVADRSELSGYALVPAIYLCITPPVGGRQRRVLAAAAAGVLVALTVTVAALVSGSTAATAIGLAVAGFGSALLPRIGPLAASMQLALIIAFAYSAGQPLDDAAAIDRGLAVLAALPISVLAAAVVFPVEQRRPLILGAAAALGDLAQGLAGGDPERDRGAAARATAQFRGALGRLRDPALPIGGSSGDRAGLALVGAVQQAIVAVDLLADDAGAASPERTGALPELAGAAGALAAVLAGRDGALPDGARLAALRARAVADGDRPLALLADALADARLATSRLRHPHRSADAGVQEAVALPPAWRRLRLSLRPADPIFRRAVRLSLACGLAGLLAGVLDLGRAYWPVFAVIIIFNAPVAEDRRRALYRVLGSLAGVVASVPLVPVAVDHHALGLAIGLLAMLPGLILMPINYAAAVGFITVTVGMLFATGGNASDFLHYRVEDQLVGALVALVVGAALWHTRREQWWTAAGETADGLAEAAGATSPASHRDALVMDLLVLRTETTEGVALRGSDRTFAAAWTFTAAAEELVRTLTGPRAEPVADPAALSARLRAVTRGRPDPAAPDVHDAASAEVAAMERAIATLRLTASPPSAACARRPGTAPP